MKITPLIHRKLWLLSLAKTGLLIGGLITLAWLSNHYSVQFDLTANRNNSLSATSIKILEKLPDPVIVRVLVHDATLRQQITDLLSRYQRHKADITIEYADPEKSPELSRKYQLTASGAVIVEYRGKYEKINYLDENSLSNALLQLAHNQTVWISFLTGHGERSLLGAANFDLGLFGDALLKRDIHPQALNLTKVAAIPDNSSLLVLSEPRVALLDEEIHLIQQYLQQGGNLLLLTEPDTEFLQPILQTLGVKKLPGQIVSPQTGLYGVENPEFILVNTYPRHPVTAGFHEITLFPGVAALVNTQSSNYQIQSLLNSSDQSWTETGDVNATSQFDADSLEQNGPLALAFSLTQTIDNRPQRIIVMGDGDFLSNAYLNNVGNLELGFRIIHWLTHNDPFIDIPPRDTVGKTLQFSELTLGLLGTFFLLVLPTGLLLAGFIIWRRRKKY
jgi:ABC-type uncharacterized transport system involved in gliding motility auxiliary subunit